jgi:mRNA interferase YafQ
MRRDLIWSTAFTKALKRIIKKDIYLAETIKTTLDLLSREAYDPRLKTHKLKGPFEGYFSCSAGYDLRIVFRMVKTGESEAILLETIGTHDEVY